jgi:hypothetical protein
MLALGFLNWLLTFMISLCLLPLEFQSDLIAQIAYGVAIVAVSGGCAWAYLQQSIVARRREGLFIGVCWTLIALALDFPARWLIDSVTPLTYLRQSGPLMLLILLTCSVAGFILRYVEVRRLKAQVRKVPPLYRSR